MHKQSTRVGNGVNNYDSTLVPTLVVRHDTHEDRCGENEAYTRSNFYIQGHRNFYTLAEVWLSPVALLNRLPRRGSGHYMPSANPDGRLYQPAWVEKALVRALSRSVLDVA